MKDPEKERFIRETLERIHKLRLKIVHAHKDKLDMSGVIPEIQKEIEDIKNEANQVFEGSKNNLSEEELEALIQNPSNFSEGDWHLLEKIKQETEATKKEIIRANEEEISSNIIGKKKKTKSVGKLKNKSNRYL